MALQHLVPDVLTLITWLPFLVPAILSGHLTDIGLKLTRGGRAVWKLCGSLSLMTSAYVGVYVVWSITGLFVGYTRWIGS